ncbi:transporter substrate-binding domain-containing protein [Streptomyces sp. NPDC086554]|uniref:transporter substrate-binding domain-containing protein n=1 Tax=Streptomyces sp. NPDC086554 TaxID=3154864 RepID=UPI00341E82DB
MKRSHRTRARRSALAVTAFLLVAVTACGDDGDEEPSLLDGTVHIGAAFDQPGFSLHANHTDRGFEVDLAAHLGKELGFTVRFQDVPTGRREQELDQGAATLVIATYSITPAREKEVDFVGPYLNTQQGFLVRKNYNKIKKEKDVQDKLICTVEGSTSARADLPPRTTIREEADFSTCVSKLQQGNVDAVFTDEALLYGYVEQQKRSKVPLKVVPDVAFGLTNRYGIGLQKGHTEDCEKLLAAVRDYLNEEWANDIKTQLPALVDTYPGDWQNRFKPDTGDLNTYSSCKAPE